MSASQWAFWLALAALIAGAGKFLEDYHIKSATKARMRNKLIQWFIWLDGQKIPDLGGMILRLVGRVFKMRRKFLIILFVIVSAYFAALTVFYVGREIFGPPNTKDYLTYVLAWISKDDSSVIFWLIYLSFIIVPGLFGLAGMAYFFHCASMAHYDPQRLVFLVAGLALGIGVALSGAALTLLVFDGGGYLLPVILMAGLASVAIPGLLAFTTLALIFARSLVRLARVVLLEVFDVASSPTASSFTYAAALLGTTILLAKVIEAAVA